MEAKIKYLILGIFLIVFIILLKEIILKPKTLETPPTISVLPETDINLQLLKSFNLKDLSSFEEISLPKEQGRENPFLEY